MSTPRKGKKGSGRRSPSPRASPHGASSSEGLDSSHSLAVSSKLQQLQISDLVDAGSGCDEARVLISPSTMIALSIRGGDLVQLEWSSANKAIRGCSGSSDIDNVNADIAVSVVPSMSIVLTAFPSITLAPYRVAVHPSILSCISPPCRLGLCNNIFMTARCLSVSCYADISYPFSLRPFSLVTKGHLSSGPTPLPLNDATLVACSIRTSSSPPLTGSWPPASQWPSLLSCRLQVVLAVDALPPIFLFCFVSVARQPASISIRLCATQVLA